MKNVILSQNMSAVNVTKSFPNFETLSITCQYIEAPKNLLQIVRNAGEFMKRKLKKLWKILQFCNKLRSKFTLGT